jgi:toxin ParE1/3/4
MARLVERPKARQELEDIAVYIGAHLPSAARRFLDAAELAYAMLARIPEIGSRWHSETPRFRGLRFLPIPRYPNYVIFCRPLVDGLEILHILHGARDLQAILEAAEGE